MTPFVFATEAEAVAFARGIELVNDSALTFEICGPQGVTPFYEVVVHDRDEAPVLDGENAREEYARAAHGPTNEAALLFIPPAIDADELVWTASGDQDPTSRLLATIVIAGTQMHLEAYRVAEMTGHDPVQRFEGDYHGTPAAVYEVIGGDGAWRTVLIGEREYVLIATPFCD